MATILIADDDALVAEALSEVLRLDGHTPTVALSGEQAIAFLKERDFDIVITDLVMPAGGGMYVSGMTRMLQGHRNIIVVSGYLSSSVAGEARRTALEGLGVRRFLRKPIELQALRGAVAEALEYGPE